MQNAIVTGSSGFLGRYILSSLSATGYRVSTLGRSKSCNINCDLSSEVPNITNAPDLVVHAAGKAHSIPTTSEEVNAFFDVNLQGTKNLCAAFDNLNQYPKSFVFVSTVAVYGVEAGVNISETHPLEGVTPYAKSKIEAELFLQEWCSQRNVRLSILRLPLVAGANPPGNLHDLINGIQRNRYFNIAGGVAKKSIVMAKDVAAFIPAVANIGGIYNLTDGQNPSFGALAGSIATQLGKQPPKNIPYWIAKTMALIGDLIGPKAPINSNKLRKITSELTFDDTKARQTLSWNPNKVLTAFTIK